MCLAFLEKQRRVYRQAGAERGKPTGDQAIVPEKKVPASPIDAKSSFVPTEPATFAEAGLNDTQVEAIVLKYLLAQGTALGRDIAEQVKLPYRPVT